MGSGRILFYSVPTAMRTLKPNTGGIAGIASTLPRSCKQPQHAAEPIQALARPVDNTSGICLQIWLNALSITQLTKKSKKKISNRADFQRAFKKRQFLPLTPCFSYALAG